MERLGELSTESRALDLRTPYSMLVASECVLYRRTMSSIRIFALSVLALTACGDDGGADQPDAAQSDAPSPDADTSPRAVTIRFEPMVGTRDFACGQTYADMGSGSTTITPRDFRFYAYDFQLIDAAGDRVAVTLDQNAWQHQNVAMLDFEDFTGGCLDGTPETNLEVTGMAPNGTYTGVRFHLGIPEVMNHTDLTTMPAPLNVTGLFWGWNFGHIFFAAVTHADIPASGTDPAGTNDHYFHLGATGCTGDATAGESVTCDHPNSPLVEVTGFDPLTEPVIADWGAVLPHVDLAASEGCHSFPGGDCDYPFDAVGLNFVTGSMTPTTQRVFKPGT